MLIHIFKESGSQTKTLCKHGNRKYRIKVNRTATDFAHTGTHIQRQLFVDVPDKTTAHCGVLQKINRVSTGVGIAVMTIGLTAVCTYATKNAISQTTTQG